MANEPSERDETPTHDTSAGSPANLSVQRPDDSELDRREREKSQPRRAAGPPLKEADLSELRSSESVELPGPTDPRGASDAPGDTDYTGDPEGGGGAPGQTRDATQPNEAGPPADYAGPKPSADELDRRDRLKAGPRRAAGPPLAADTNAERAASLHQPPPPTDPRE